MRRYSQILALPGLCLSTVLPALAAEQPLSAEQFEALSVGRTFFYNSGGTSYGAEQYLPGRRVIWAFTGDDCRKGTWYPEGKYICFVYEDDLDPQCWTFFRGAGGLTAQFRDDPVGEPLIAVEESPEPMACMGPDIGV
jgi:hypothetical protein